MSESDSGFTSGLIIGSFIGAGAALLFGTKKGEEIRKKIREEYPDFFDQLDEVVSSAKENVSDKYQEVAKEINPVKKEIKKTTRRFFRGKKHL